MQKSNNNPDVQYLNFPPTAAPQTGKQPGVRMEGQPSSAPSVKTAGNAVRGATVPKPMRGGGEMIPPSPLQNMASSGHTTSETTQASVVDQPAVSELEPAVYQISMLEGDRQYRIPLICGCLGACLGFIIVFLLQHQGWVTTPTRKLLVGLLPFQICMMIGGVMALLRFQGKSFCRILDWQVETPPPLRSRIIRFLSLFILVILLNLLLSAVMNFIGEKLGIPMPPQDLILLSKDAPPVWWGILLFSTVILAPLSEEILFRQILFRSLRSLFPLRATLMTAFLFGAFHTNLRGFPFLMVLGVILQGIRRRNGLRAAVLFHALYNLHAVVLLYLMQRFGQIEGL